MDLSNISNFGKGLRTATADLLAGSDFISRTIGMNDSYEGIMFLIQSLGREPVSLLGKDYLYIFDHVRRNFQQGTTIGGLVYGQTGGQQDKYDCAKFTFYKEKPTVRFVDVYNDPLNLLDRWKPDVKFTKTKHELTGYYYAESHDGYTNNKSINNFQSNNGVATNQTSSSFPRLSTCDLIRKTNDNFNSGKYKTLIARFHTNSDDSRVQDDPTQSANSELYGLSHGRNLLRKYSRNLEINGYNNPYCRVWTYHHQYNQISRAIRPFSDVNSEEAYERLQLSGEYNTIGFRTMDSKDYDVVGGSKALDRYGVLNYENGFVNIAPTAKIKDYFEHKPDDKERRSVSTKRCMFSIENLAWRDEKAKPDEFEPYGLSAEQRGPLGGRIMWFPPYDLQFSEDVNVKWNENEFIGRGENIYTYTNTKRTGNLSFTLLIDHPAILDYWTGNQRNGMKNLGQPLAPGNTPGNQGNGIDNADNQENTLLRFFAGCQILSAKPQEYWRRDKSPEKVAQKDPEPIKTVPNPDPPAPEEVEKDEGPNTLCCVLYFPNNYSGKDDYPNAQGTVNAIHYLMNGIGAQKYVNYIEGNNFLKEVDIPTQVDEKVSVYQGTVQTNDNTCKELGNNCNEACDENGIVTSWSLLNNYGGYEMSENPISVADKILNTGYTNVSKSFSCLGKGKRAQYICNENCTIRYGVKSEGRTVQLAKIVDTKAKTLEEAKNATYFKKSGPGSNQWYRKRWYYRVDNVYSDDDFTHPISYIDAQSFKLNSSGFDFRTGKYVDLNGKEVSIGKSDWIKYVEEDSDKFTLVSFSDFFCALEGTKQKAVSPVNAENVELIKSIINGKDSGIKVKKVTICGNASAAGRVSTNKDLSKNRAETIMKWMNKKGFPKQEEGEYTITSDTRSNQNHVDNGDASSLMAKVWRSATIIVEYQKEDEAPANEIENGYQVKDGEVVRNTDKTSSEGAPLAATESVSIPNLNTSKGGMLGPKDWLYNTPEGQNILKYGYTKEEYVRMPDGTISKIEKREQVNPNTFTMAEAGKILGKDYINPYSLDFDNSYLNLKELPNANVTKSVVKRYDNEGEFFELLGKNEPFLHYLTSEKIRYFDPAFHSISPEGFNARLTFLQQCSRQGPTVGNSDADAKTAYNLAFGRPPICVLRIGDFYYTKIVINSLQIKYDQPQMQWDLNPEGIGVMPMSASISINFTFLGGSDLAGPIARLQNAVSFNYYANASVYDNRAERVRYDENGSGKEVRYRPFTYPNLYGRMRTMTEDSVGNTYDIARENKVPEDL